MKILKDYDCSIRYYPDKSNVVIDALSKKSFGSLTHISTKMRPLIKELHDMVEHCL